MDKVTTRGTNCGLSGKELFSIVMTSENPDTTNLIVISGLEGNPAVTLTPMQAALKPYVPEMEIFWWAIWIGVLVYVTTFYIVKPLRKR
jgi:hypothetical protein